MRWRYVHNYVDMNALHLENIEKKYVTGTHALKSVSFAIPQGSMLALLGANGAGKTTLIGMLTGLVRKTGGKATVFGVDMDAASEEVRSLIGVVPQEFNFSIFEKVIDIVVDQGGYYGVPRPVALERAKDLLQQLGLWEKRDAVARTLSGGMKRRLMIARALVHQPKLLLLDEPSAGVDVELRRGMWDFVRRIHEQGTTVLLTTHYLEEAQELCDRVVILRRGEVVRDASIAELLRELKAQSFVLEVENGEDQVMEVTLTDGKTVTDLVTELAAKGVIVRDIRPKANRLEEVFMEASQ